MPARALWSGSISFGLVNVPVRVFSAVHEHKLQFHLVHADDDGPIGYEKICKLEDKAVPNDEIVKAFEYEKGKVVHLTDDDFEAVRVDGQHTIDLEEFVPYDQIDPTFFAHAYVVAPADGAESPYALLVHAMTDAGLVGVGRFVMRNRQYLGCIRVHDEVLILEQLHFADEVKIPSGILPTRLPAAKKGQLDLARSLIEGLAGDWRPEKYRDEYTAALRKVVKQKVAGRDVHVEREVEEPETIDLMDALRESVARMQSNGKTSNGGASKKELDATAKRLGIAGRSKMSKPQLERAIARARRAA